MRAILGAALLALPSAAGAAPASHLVSDQLSHARTIQVRETMLKPGNDGKLSQKSDIDVRMERPKKVKLVISTLGGSAPDQYVSDGESEFEYDARTNSYRLGTLGADGKPQALVRKSTLVDLILE
ncbi:MAG: hypothetical protein JWQ02_2014, partial [Capsulimonas sp.]|nr:hypothetical protein [Capsulimonas sp.]